MHIFVEVGGIILVCLGYQHSLGLAPCIWHIVEIGYHEFTAHCTSSLIIVAKFDVICQSIASMIYKCREVLVKCCYLVINHYIVSSICNNSFLLFFSPTLLTQ